MAIVLYLQIEIVNHKMAPVRFLLVSTHTEQVTGYSKVSYNLLKQLGTLAPLVKIFHFGFQRTPGPSSPARSSDQGRDPV
jgi:hypothetical protein